MSETIRQICWIRGSYLITKRGRRWLTGTNVTPGQKPYRDRIEINTFSQSWQPGETHEIFALHVDDVSAYGHKVSLIPISQEEYWLAPAEARF